MSFWKNTRGATAIEYGLIAAGIAIAIIAAINALGTSLGCATGYKNCPASATQIQQK